MSTAAVGLRAELAQQVSLEHTRIGRRTKVEIKLRMQVEVAPGNQSLCRGDVGSCGYARPFDRMPVEVTQLHSSLEGVTPTEVESSLYLSSERQEGGPEN